MEDFFLRSVVAKQLLIIQLVSCILMFLAVANALRRLRIIRGVDPKSLPGIGPTLVKRIRYAAKQSFYFAAAGLAIWIAATVLFQQLR